MPTDTRVTDPRCAGVGERLEVRGGYACQAALDHLGEQSLFVAIVGMHERVCTPASWAM